MGDTVGMGAAIFGGETDRAKGLFQGGQRGPGNRDMVNAEVHIITENNLEYTLEAWRIGY
jgi:hypothetical protein